jgi:hypothetical protein
MNFPEINYKQGFEDLTNDSFEKNSSLKGILSLVTGNNIKQPLNFNPLEGFTRLSEVEFFLFKKINSFSNISKINDNEIIDIFHKIQCWGGRGGRRVYQGEGFNENFNLEVYKKVVSYCLSLDINTDWVNEASEWTFDLNEIFGMRTSFSTKHIRFWLYKKLKDNTPPILDEVIQGKKEDKTGMWISGLNFYNQISPIDRYKKKDLERYWVEMIKKSKEENISLLDLERILFNHFRNTSKIFETTQKIILKTIDDGFKSEIKELPDFDYLVLEIVSYIVKHSVNEDYFEELIEFTFQGRNTPKYYGSMEEYLLENKFMFEDS